MRVWHRRKQIYIEYVDGLSDLGLSSETVPSNMRNMPIQIIFRTRDVLPELHWYIL